MKTEDESQKTGDGSQKTEDGRQKTEERGCRAGGKESLLAQSR